MLVSDAPADQDGLAHGLGVECSAIATSMIDTQLTGLTQLARSVLCASDEDTLPIAWEVDL